MKEKLIIFTSKANDLNSVNSISNDLEKLYQNFSKQYEILTYHVSQQDPMNSEILDNLIKQAPKFITFIHPLTLRNDSLAILIKMLKNKSVTFIFHLYGDFLRQSAPILRVAEMLINEKCLFLSASSGYSEVIKFFFLNPESLQVLPFPVVMKQEKTVTRRLENNEVNIIYSGRISREKNVEKISLLLKDLSKQGVDCKLHLVGSYDDFESSTVGNSPQLGEMYQVIKEQLADNEVNYLGFKTIEELALDFKKMDLFVSLSLYHDDDFGRSPIEALMCGLPCLLTEWIGYKDIHFHFPEYVFLLETEWDGVEYKVSFEGVSNWLSKKSRLTVDVEKIHDFYSPLKIFKELSKLLENNVVPFKGFSNEFMKIAQKGALYFYNQDGSFNNERYTELYVRPKNV